MGKEAETKPNGAFKPHRKRYQLVFEGIRSEGNRRFGYNQVSEYSNDLRRNGEVAVL